MELNSDNLEYFIDEITKYVNDKEMIILFTRKISTSEEVK
jgi:hypothetical protein